MTTLGNTLASLANDMNAAAAAPGNAAYVSRVMGDLSVVNTVLNGVTFLTSFAAGLNAAGASVAQASASTLPAALGNLDAAV